MTDVPEDKTSIEYARWVADLLAERDAIDRDFAAELRAEERRQRMSDPTFDRDRLLHYMRALDDPDTGRRAAAARGIAQFVKQNGLSWDDILVRQETVAGRPVPIVAPIQNWPHVEFAETMLGAVDKTINTTPWEKDFLTSIVQWKRPPTDKQSQALVRMFHKYRSHVNGLVGPCPQPGGMTPVPPGRFAPITFTSAASLQGSNVP